MQRRSIVVVVALCMVAVQYTDKFKAGYGKSPAAVREEYLRMEMK